MKTVTTYRNAGRTKISDGAMLWILFAFVAYPVEAVRFQVSAIRYEGLSVGDSFTEIGPWLWRSNVMVWESL